MILFLILVTKINLSLWTNKPDHHVESVHVRSLFLVRIFSHIWTEYGDLQIKSPHSLRMWRNMGQTNPECKHFSRSWRQNIVINTHTHVHNTYIHVIMKQQCAFPLITTVALWQLMHLGTWYAVYIPGTLFSWLHVYYAHLASVRLWDLCTPSVLDHL